MHITFADLPIIGRTLVASHENRIVRIALGRYSSKQVIKELEKSFGPCEHISGSSYNERFIKELRNFLSGRRRVFKSRIHLLGTDFQKKVWQAAIKIPYGKVASYGDIAERIGRQDASRAVGNAMGANPIPLIVPCHRVIRSDGSLGGFGAGTPLKKKLLALEGTKA